MKIETLEKLLSEATPGPWDWNNDATESEYFEQVVLRNGLRICEINGDNAKLICALRNVAPAMLDVIKAAKALGYSRVDSDLYCECVTCQLADALRGIEEI